MLRVLAINGSLRSGSHNGALLRAAGALLPSGVELVELTGLAHLPAYSQDHDVSPPPATVAALRDALAAAVAVLISTPEYNSCIPPGVSSNTAPSAAMPTQVPDVRWLPLSTVSVWPICKHNSLNRWPKNSGDAAESRTAACKPTKPS